MIALTLDLKLRLETAGRVSLDDVMQACWRRWGEGDEGIVDSNGEGRPLHDKIEKNSAVDELAAPWEKDWNKRKRDARKAEREARIAEQEARGDS